MADKLADAEDRLLESVFKAERITDDGFSKRVVSRIRRRLWFRRLAVPVAATIGGLFAIQPLIELVRFVSDVLGITPGEFTEMTSQLLPQVQLIVLGGMIFVVFVTLVQFFEET